MRTAERQTFRVTSAHGAAVGWAAWWAAVGEGSKVTQGLSGLETYTPVTSTQPLHSDDQRVQSKRSSSNEGIFKSAILYSLPF